VDEELRAAADAQLVPGHCLAEAGRRRRTGPRPAPGEAVEHSQRRFVSAQS
jgi:hypothetical protein